MHNRQVLMCLLCPMRMSVPKVQMECREKKESREEKKKYPCAPGRYISSQHNIFTLLLLVIGEKSLFLMSTLCLFHRVPAISHRAGRLRPFPVRE